MAQDWMKWFSDDMLVTELSIPGTHDSHATKYNVNNNTLAVFAATQHAEITDQLDMGVRYLDLRVGEGKGMRHGMIGLRDELRDVLKRVKSWLDNFKTETVLISIMWDHDRAVLDSIPEADWFQAHVFEHWREFNWYWGAEWPSLGMVRGKAVLLRRFQRPRTEDGICGIDINGIGGFETRPVALAADQNSRTVDHGPGLWHSKPIGMACGDDTTTKWSQVREHLQMARERWEGPENKKDRIMYFTNLAGVNVDPKQAMQDAHEGRFNPDKMMTPEIYANVLNPQLETFLKAVVGSNKRFGIVIVDFITAFTSECIWTKNF